MTADAASRLEGIIGLALGAQALGYKDPAGLDAFLADADPEFVGFGVEGAAMGLFMRSVKRDDADALAAFRAGPWGCYAALVYAGIGLGMGELHVPVEPFVAEAGDVMAAFTVDGYGFHFGLNAPGVHLQGQPWPDGVAGDMGRLFDVGLARSLWFGSAADPAAVVAGVSLFAAERRDDLWAGIGFAATYAGGSSESGFALLLDTAGPSSPSLAAGSALASYVRTQCGNPVASTDAACQRLTGLSTSSAHALCAATAGEDVSAGGFLAWRGRMAEGL
ncbi:MAG TPA: DUF1702 family protein [Acidimicrobiales bacterium]|nr:DUF1702 family protein [Acidimicrobiales bacterium]